MKLTCGVGYLGTGNFSTKTNEKCYNVWRQMLNRCYNEKILVHQSSYRGCSVDERWHNFQNFCENYLNMIGECDYHLDKDILIKGNKIYSKDTCCLVPSFINNLFTKSNKRRGSFPIGISFNKEIGKFESYVRKNNKKIHLGWYKTPEEAFHVYKTAKEEYIKEVAEEYKDKLDPRVYNALMNYEVEITD